ncbi:hypothetical protein CcaCcLH18_05802 [Colletotrichum camelliae]|nr:hypothetical protein CcaCcLH18_05802 [Colletotrichum camelliae]
MRFDTTSLSTRLSCPDVPTWVKAFQVWQAHGLIEMNGDVPLGSRHPPSGLATAHPNISSANRCVSDLMDGVTGDWPRYTVGWHTVQHKRARCRTGGGTPIPADHLRPPSFPPEQLQLVTIGSRPSSIALCLLVLLDAQGRLGSFSRMFTVSDLSGGRYWLPPQAKYAGSLPA